MKKLTQAEEEIMQILWRIEEGFVKDLRGNFLDPKPAYNTVSTIIRILEKKGFVAHKPIGKSHLYYPIVTEDAYKKFYLDTIMEGYFENSFDNLVSFFAKEKKLTEKEILGLLEMIKKEIQ